MFIPDPGSWFLPIPVPGSRIPYPKIAKKERGEKKFAIILFFVVTNFTKLNIILVLKCWRKKFGPIFKELLKFLPEKFSLCSQIYGFGIRDPGSGKPIPDPGSRGQKGTGSATLGKVRSDLVAGVLCEQGEPLHPPEVPLRGADVHLSRMWTGFQEQEESTGTVFFSRGSRPLLVQFWSCILYHFWKQMFCSVFQNIIFSLNR